MLFEHLDIFLIVFGLLGVGIALCCALALSIHALLEACGRAADAWFRFRHRRTVTVDARTFDTLCKELLRD